MGGGRALSGVDHRVAVVIHRRRGPGGEKKTLYQDIFRTPEYFWFSPEDGEFAGFRLDGRGYRPIPVDGEGRCHSQVLGLSLGSVAGQLRYFEGDAMLPTPAEAAQAEHQRAEALAARLRALGVDPDADRG